jgi:hypothetical protein
MADILTKTKTILRAVVGDIAANKTDVFPWSTGDAKSFTLTKLNVANVTSVNVNGHSLGSAEWDYSAGIVSVSASLEDGDVVTVVYTFNKYTEDELTEWIRASLCWLTVCNYKDYELSGTNIYPTPTNRETDLIALVASILMKPDMISYKTTMVSATFPEQLPKEDRIKKLVVWFGYNVGACGVIEYKL